MNTEEFIGSTDHVLSIRQNVTRLDNEAVVIPKDFSVVDLEKFLPYPRRVRREVRLLNMKDLLQFIDEELSSRHFVPVWFVNAGAVSCVMNYEDLSPDAPHGWGDSRAYFEIVRTREWLDWRENSGAYMSQEVFCDFIEDHMETIYEPSGADLLEMCRNFRKITRVEYSSSFRASDGLIGLSYKESDQGATKDMVIPDAIKIRVPIVLGAEDDTTYDIKARVRVRIDKETHKLRMCYDMVRPEVPDRNALRDLETMVRTARPGDRVYCGKLEK